MKKPELIEQLGELIKEDFDKILDERLGFKLTKDSDPCSQEYYYGFDKHIITEEQLNVIFNEFRDRYLIYGIGLLISPSKLLFGIAHLNEIQRLFAIDELNNNRLNNT
jgi:hypothetical protein